MSGMGVRRCASRGAGARPALRGHTSARARAGSRRPNCCSRRRRRWCAVDRSGRARRAGVGAHRRGPRGACAVPQRLAAAATGRSRRMGQITHQRRNRPPSALPVLPPPKLEPPESASGREGSSARSAEARLASFPLFSAWSSAAPRTGFERTAITRGDFLEHSTLRQCSFNFSQRCGDPTHAAAAASQQNQYSRQHRPLTLLVRARRRQKACDLIQVSRFDHFVARAVRSLHLCDSKPYPRMPRLDAWRGSSRLTEVAFRLAASFSGWLLLSLPPGLPLGHPPSPSGQRTTQNLQCRLPRPPAWLRSPTPTSACGHVTNTCAGLHPTRPGVLASEAHGTAIHSRALRSAEVCRGPPERRRVDAPTPGTARSSR